MAYNPYSLFIFFFFPFPNRANVSSSTSICHIHIQFHTNTKQNIIKNSFSPRWFHAVLPYMVYQKRHGCLKDNKLKIMQQKSPMQTNLPITWHCARWFDLHRVDELIIVSLDSSCTYNLFLFFTLKYLKPFLVKYLFLDS